MESFKHYKTNDRVYQIKDPMDVFVTLIVGEKKALLLDTGMGIYDLNAYVKTLTDLPLIVVNSHGHVDHMNGNYQFPMVYLHPLDFDLASEHGSKQWKSMIYNEVDNEGMLPEIIDKHTYIHSGRGNVQALDEGKVFDLGGITLEVVCTPGHTAGSISLLCREEKILFVGDAVNNYLFLFLPESLTLSVYKDTLQKVKKLDFEKLVTGHYYAPVPKSRVDSFLHCAESVNIKGSSEAKLELMGDYEPLIFTDTIELEPSGYVDIEGENGDAKFASILFTADRI